MLGAVFVSDDARPRPALSNSALTRYLLLPPFCVVFTAPTHSAFTFTSVRSPKRDRQREKTFFYYNIPLRKKKMLAGRAACSECCCFLQLVSLHLSEQAGAGTGESPCGRRENMKRLDSPRTEYIYSLLNAQMNTVEARDGAFILTSPVLDFL